MWPVWPQSEHVGSTRLWLLTPACWQCRPREAAAAADSRDCVPAAHVGDQDWVSSFQHQPGPTHAEAGIWGGNEQMNQLLSVHKIQRR